VRPLSAEPPRLLAPPLDEATLAGHALRTGRRRRLRRYDPGTDTWRDPTPTTGGSTSASDTRPEGEQGTPLQSGSGRFGGAGATGGWDADTARPPGVDSAGRILGTAAAAAAAAAAIGLSGVGQGDAGQHTADAEPASDTSTHVSTSY
jgi:hypothetical protein